MSNIRHNFILMLNIGISFLGLLIVLALTFNPPIIHEAFFWRKPLVGSIFSLICMLGITAALFPKQCSQSFHFQREGINLASRKIRASSHHPDCEGFSAHVIRVNGHILCAACTGLFLGALIALVGAVLYFFAGWHIENARLPAVLMGAVGTTLGFFQLKFRSFIRLALNVSFVLGAFLILVGTDAIIESLFVDFFLIALIIFWISTRIQLSQWDHRRICSSCKSSCKAWKTEEKQA